MTEKTTSRTADGSTAKVTSTPARAASNEVEASDGRTTIANTVVSKIAGIAAREVAGVYDLGGGATRAVGVIRERIPGSRTNQGQGVTVEVGERQAAVDVTLVAEYGASIVDLAAGIRRNVIASIERMTGLEVTEVNIDVQDIHLESDEDQAPAEPRVE